MINALIAGLIIGLGWVIFSLFVENQKPTDDPSDPWFGKKKGEWENDI